VEPDSDEESEEEEPAAAPKFNPFDLLSDDEVQLRGCYCSMCLCTVHRTSAAPAACWTAATAQTDAALA
jgi:hypothetical protein